MYYSIRILPNKVIQLLGSKTLSDPRVVIAESLDSSDFLPFILNNWGSAS